MTALVHQRCWNHASREAAARCPVCQRFYCRECVTEHEGRMMCAGCAANAAERVAEAPRSKTAIWALCGVAGILLAWMIFYYLGAMLARIPSDFFEKPA
ncbi:MAG: rhomboid family protein [Acidobacteriia bacterium]|nr:rhomboid family protein [Terriglobia bacterium]